MGESNTVVSAYTMYAFTHRYPYHLCETMIAWTWCGVFVLIQIKEGMGKEKRG